jgi:NADH dehydrogenase
VLHGLRVEVLVGEKVVEITRDKVKTATGHEVSADFSVWAAGIRCAEVLKEIDGLESNRVNQLVALSTLQTTRDPDIFALGDCSAVPWKQDRLVPPRAQAAHQESSHLVKTLRGRLEGRAPTPFRYRDFGSLVSLGAYDTVGQLMGFLGGGKLRVEGVDREDVLHLALPPAHLALHGSGAWRSTRSRA